MKKGDVITFLDYTITFCTNNDGIVISKKGGESYETHLGNYSTLETAKIACVFYFMLARPQSFATGVFYRLIMGERGGTMHEWYKLKNVLIAEGLEMPKELHQAYDGMNQLIGFNGLPLRAAWEAQKVNR